MLSTPNAAQEYVPGRSCPVCKIGVQRKLRVTEVAAIGIRWRTSDHTWNQRLNGSETLDPIDDAQLIRDFERRSIRPQIPEENKAVGLKFRHVGRCDQSTTRFRKILLPDSGLSNQRYPEISGDSRDVPQFSKISQARKYY